MCLALFFTDFVGQSIYDGDPLAPLGTQKGDAYKKGVEFGSWGMAINAASSSIYCCQYHYSMYSNHSVLEMAWTKRRLHIIVAQHANSNHDNSFAS